MKAKIGKYIHWYNTHRIEDAYLKWRHKKYAWDIDERDHDWIDKTVMKLLDGWQSVLHYTINQIQNRRERKIKVHVDAWDVVNANETLAHVILPVLKKIREDKQGAPFVDSKDVPKELRPKKLTKKQKENGEVDDKHFERWDWVLGEMIFAFECMVDDSWEDQFFSGESDIVWIKVDAEGNEVDDDHDGMIYYRMGRGPNDTFHFDKEGYDKFSKRIDEGLRLFGKYYRGLWT